ncbi:MAG: hypothetical protein J5762_01770 [Clostridia bacterium]|nr:hypothetical protein [Clostridia bacterium]
MAKNKTAKRSPAPAKKKEGYSKGLTDISGRDGFYRNQINVGRWAYGADIFRSNLSKIIGLNLMMLVFVAPIAYFLFVRYSQQFTLAHSAPFAGNVGVGYTPFPNLVALEESINLDINMYFFLKLPLMALWLGIGLSGGMYVMRNICWGEEVRLFKDFWLGIKRNIVPVTITTILFSIVFASAFIAISYVDYSGATAGGKTWYQIVFKVLLIIAAVYVSLWFMTMLSLNVTYKGGYFSMMRNGVLLTTVLLPVNIFFAAFALLPFVFFFIGSSFLLFGAMAVIIIGVSFFMFVWTAYSQWVYDKFVNINVKNTYVPTEADIKLKKEREAKTTSAAEDESYDTVGAPAAAQVNYIKVAKPINDDVTVSDLPTKFTLGDIKKVKESKGDMIKDAEEYAADPKAYLKAHNAEEEEFEIPEELVGTDENVSDAAVNQPLERPLDKPNSGKKGNKKK